MLAEHPCARRDEIHSQKGKFHGLVMVELAEHLFVKQNRKTNIRKNHIFSPRLPNQATD